MNYIFPFTAIVGLELVKRSLLYHAIDTKLGGLLLMGQRGCAKSTLARSFREILPSVSDYQEAPFVEVPLGTSEDRLLGAIDPSRLLADGKWSVQTGLIQQANNGVLYIDEVNLLPDHLVDSILDSATSGQHRIERDGLSKNVNARYILVGSMNPEEGDLRPQLTDRFVHGVMVKDDFSVQERRDIVRLRMDFDDNPSSFVEEHQLKLERLRDQILQARKHLKNVKITENLRTEVAEKAVSLNLEGVRAELGIIRTARCAAALRRDVKISKDDLEEAWILCLGHRQEQNTPKDHNSKIQVKYPELPIEKTETNQIKTQRTSFSPEESQRDKIFLDAAQSKLNSKLAEWWVSQNKKQSSDKFISGTSRSVPKLVPEACLCWPSSLKASFLKGWSPGQPWHPRYRKISRRNNFWLFLDASRSTGVINNEFSTRFLSSVRNAVNMLGSKTFSSRFHLLVLQNGQARWWIKRGTAQGIRKTLNQLTEASGKSHLTKALNQLFSAIKKQGVLSGDRVLLCTDGMLSPEKGKSVSESKIRFRKALLNLSQRVNATLWLHPLLKRGMRHLLPQLTEGTSVRLLSLD
tara:strand:+ start:395 stop:2131 length:1737 start_codon:yes stop_codon:yes gene_type:complete